MPSLGKSESFHMQTEEWPRSGTVVSEFFHGHHSLTDEAWVIAGATKESVKEVVAAFVSRVLGKPHVVQGLGTIPVDLGRTGGERPPLPLSKVKTALLLALSRAKDVELLCRYLPTTELVREPTTSTAVGSPLPGFYDRAAVSTAGWQGGRRRGGVSEPCAILGHRFIAGQSLTTICFSLRTTHVVGTGFKTTERLREPSAADEPFRLDDGTELVPHQHCNWGSSVAFDGDR